MRVDIEKRLRRVEEVVATAEPRRFVYPFGTFDTPAEAHAHPAMGPYVEMRRQQAFHSYNHTEGV